MSEAMNFLREAIPDIAALQSRAELLDISARIFAARVTAGRPLTPEDAVHTARALIEAVEGSIEADGLPGVEYEEEDEDEEDELGCPDCGDPTDGDGKLCRPCAEDHQRAASLAGGVDELDWNPCVDTDGCAMRGGHNGACWSPDASFNGTSDVQASKARKAFRDGDPYDSLHTLW